MTVKVLLFDLGGVLVDFVGPQRLRAMLSEDLSLSEVRRRWPLSAALRRFETGQVKADRFAREFVREWGIALAPADFLRDFSTWSLAVYPGALALLDELRGKAILACLTNMNSVYWEKVRDGMGVGSRLDRCYASHEMGLLKPDRAIYKHVVADLEHAPEEIAFFDDTEMNVEGARAIGMQGHLVQGVAQLRAALSQVIDS